MNYKTHFPESYKFPEWSVRDDLRLVRVEPPVETMPVEPEEPEWWVEPHEDLTTPLDRAVSLPMDPDLFCLSPSPDLYLAVRFKVHCKVHLTMYVAVARAMAGLVWTEE